MKKQKTVILIAGPTAVGKTSVAIKVARHFGAQILSADSRQCYKELKIGVARPSPHELAAVPHHFIATHSIQQKVTAATFEAYALEKAAELFRHSDTLVLVGGTGLYIKAFLEGLDEIPEVPEDIRNRIVALYKAEGLVGLQAELQQADPSFLLTGETENPHRLMRALEVVLATGKSVLSFRKAEKKERPFTAFKIGLQLPKEVLHQNINQRVEAMVEAGLVEEVALLQPQQQLNALQTVGYKEIFGFLNGDSTLPQAIETIKQNTRQYAKRQRTWFQKDEEIHWLAPDAEVVIRAVEAQKKA